MGRFAILCPGQGGQHAGMFEILGGLPHDRAQLSNLGGHPLDTALARIDILFANRSAQVLVVAATLAAWHALQTHVPQPALVAGYSVGELSAHAVAGTLSADQAMSLAVLRAAAMDACVGPGAPQGLLAVSGVRHDMLTAMLPSSGLWLAIENGPDAHIVGGHAAALDEFAIEAARAGARSTRLQVAVASHTPLMAEAAEQFRVALQDAALSAPGAAVLAGISGARVTSAAAAVASLSGQIMQTIRWMDCMDALAEAGIDVALELGPGAALSRMLRERHPHIEVRSVSDFRSIRGVAAWVGRHAV